jgi:hypothetical protein
MHHSSTNAVPTIPTQVARYYFSLVYMLIFEKPLTLTDNLPMDKVDLKASHHVQRNHQLHSPDCSLFRIRMECLSKTIMISDVTYCV